jgi:hypothetical protein
VGNHSLVYDNFDDTGKYGFSSSITDALFSRNRIFRSTEFKNRGISFCKLINNFHFGDIKIIFREFPARIQKARKNPHFSFLFSFSVPKELSHFEIGGDKRISRHLSGPARPGTLTGQVKFAGEKCKCATAENPAAHWAIRSTLEAIGAQRRAGCNTCCWEVGLVFVMRKRVGQRLPQAS